MNTHGKWAEYLQLLEGECGNNTWDGNEGKCLQARVCVFTWTATEANGTQK